MADSDDQARRARERREAIERAIANGTFGQTKKPPASAPRTSPRDVPLGSGSAGQAKRAVGGRQRQIDNAVEQAERGSLSNARRPRSY